MKQKLYLEKTLDVEEILKDFRIQMELYRKLKHFQLEEEVIAAFEFPNYFQVTQKR